MKRVVIMSVGLGVAIAWPWNLVSGACTPAGNTADEKAILTALEGAIEGYNRKSNDDIHKHVTRDLHTKRTDHQATGETKSEETHSSDDYGQINVRDWNRFKDHKVSNCRVSNVRVSGGTASLDVQYDFTFSKDNKPPDGKPDGSTVPMQGKFKYKKESGEWRISDVDVRNTNRPSR